jgi:hypothetical protein
MYIEPSFPIESSSLKSPKYQASDSLFLKDIEALKEASIISLLTQLSFRGFACVTLDHEDLNYNLERALDEAANLQGFRFPPIDQEIIYTDRRRKAFQALFSTATICLKALCTYLQRYHDDFPASLLHTLDQILSPDFQLFGEHFDQNEPFTSGQNFSQTFFNLFNYNNGLLNAHVDRSLLTVIKVRSFKPDSLSDSIPNKSALWVKDQVNVWRNADEEVSNHQVVIMVGEDFEALIKHLKLSLFAAEHAVRVDPTGDYLSHSHFRADPDTTTSDNRLSAALILRHDPFEDS